jgi:hypothetical protein
MTKENLLNLLSRQSKACEELCKIIDEYPIDRDQLIKLQEEVIYKIWKEIDFQIEIILEE